MSPTFVAVRAAVSILICFVSWRRVARSAVAILVVANCLVHEFHRLSDYDVQPPAFASTASPLPQTIPMPAENLGIPHETYVTLAFTHEAPRRRRLIPRAGVADGQHPAAVRDDKAAAAV
jgi:hypothetical protein